MDLKLGKILTDEIGLPDRDAIHISVKQVVAGEDLIPGEDVGVFGVESNSDSYIVVSLATDNIGVVDPMLKSMVKKGQRFWLWLYPNTVTALTHQWSHPSFPDVSLAETKQKEKSVKWIEKFAQDWELGYEFLMDEAEYAVNNDNPYIHTGSSDLHEAINPEFWTHFEIVTGKKVPDHIKSDSSFTCSC